MLQYTKPRQVSRVPPQARESRRDRQEYSARVTFKALRVMTARISRAFGAEREIFAILLKTNLPVLRSFEASPVDGALLINMEPNNPSVDLSHQRGPFEMVDWLVERKGCVKFLHFDVKMKFLTMSKRSRTDYDVIRFVKGSSKIDAEFYIACLQGVRDYFAVVPKRAYEALAETLIGAGVGTTYMISQGSTWLTPFMVHKDDLAETLVTWGEAAKTEGVCVVENKTTGVRFHGLVPKLLEHGLTFGCSQRTGEISLAAIRKLHADLKIAGVEFKNNPHAPFICDFFLRVPGVRVALRIEHKVGPGNVDPLHVRSPFHASRRWHFAIWQWPGDDDTVFCMGLQSVPLAWSDSQAGRDETVRRILHDEQYAFRGPERTNKLVAMMRSQAEKAIARSKSLTQERFALKTILHEETPDFERAFTPFNLFTNRAHELLNEQCYRAEQGVFHALPCGHPWGDYVLIEHKWSASDVDIYKYRRAIPPLYAKKLRDRRCVVVQMWELAYERVHELGMHCFRSGDWKKHHEGQPHFFILGSSACLGEAEELYTNSPCILLPSGFTAYHSTRNLMQNTDDDKSGHDGSKYYRFGIESLAPFPKLPDATRGTPLLNVMTNRFHDTRRLAVRLADGSVYKHLVECLDASGPEMSIINPQSNKPNDSFSKQNYVTTVLSVQQAAWDFGLHKPKWLDHDEAQFVKKPEKTPGAAKAVNVRGEEEEEEEEG